MLLINETILKYGYNPENLAINSKKIVIVQCNDCGKIRETSKKGAGIYCISCSLKRSYKEGRREIIKVLPTCKYCHKILGRIGKTYCSPKCKHDEEYRVYIAKWLSGQETGSIKDNAMSLSRFVRRYIRERDKNQCVLCGWDKINPITNKSPLHIDHIDGDYKNNQDNNLRLLCPNCHSLTSTYGSLNIGNGRPWHVNKG